MRSGCETVRTAPSSSGVRLPEHSGDKGGCFMGIPAFALLFIIFSDYKNIPI